VLNKKADPITIKNVVVSIKEGSGDRKFPPKKEEAILDQIGCQYSPHVLAVGNGRAIWTHSGLLHSLWGLAISGNGKSFVYKHLRIKHNLPAVPEVARKCKPTCRCRGRGPFAG